jgi:transposase
MTSEMSMKISSLLDSIGVYMSTKIATHYFSMVLGEVPPYNLPAIGTKIAYKVHRDGVAARFADAAVQNRIAVDLALIPSYDEWLRDVELTLLKTAKHPDANTLYLRPTVPGIGKILSLVLLYAIPQINRFPSVQDCVSYCRLVKCAKASAGQRLGPAGAKIGQAHLQWAFSEAAGLFLSDHLAAQQSLARLEKKHDQGKA